MAFIGGCVAFLGHVAVVAGLAARVEPSRTTGLGAGALSPSASKCPSTDPVPNPFPNEKPACITQQMANAGLASEIINLSKRAHNNDLRRFHAWARAAEVDALHDGMSPLMRAASLGMYKVVDALAVELHADASMLNQADCSATDYSVHAAEFVGNQGERDEFLKIMELLTCRNASSNVTFAECSTTCHLVEQCSNLTLGHPTNMWDAPQRAKCPKDFDGRTPTDPSQGCSLKPLSAVVFVLIATGLFAAFP